MTRAPMIESVATVTARHGDAFAEELAQRACVRRQLELWGAVLIVAEQAWETGVVWEACDEAGVIVWPEDDTYAQERYQVLQDDICERAMQAAKAGISKAFVSAAREVLDHERRRR